MTTGTAAPDKTLRARFSLRSKYIQRQTVLRLAQSTIAAGAAYLAWHIRSGRMDRADDAAALVAGSIFVFLSGLVVQSVINVVASLLPLDPHRMNRARLLGIAAGWLLTFMAGLLVLGFSVKQLLVSGAVTGSLIGLAGQHVLGNALAGLNLLLSQPFRMGDDIVVHSANSMEPFRGTVGAITLTHTHLQTDDGPLTIPNSAMMASATTVRRPAR